LYSPPDALEIFLEAFEGPFDLLLWLIRRQNIDILDIPVADVTRQYMAYVELMHEVRFELAADYLVMAAMLAEIKSRMLLPRPQEVDAEESEEDPRLELIRRLQEYERYKNAAETMRRLPQWERDLFPARVLQETADEEKPLPDVSLDELVNALAGVLE
ncbi:MAG: segregation/condensation protein A, partial [Gammaproteobacteria bacterium]